MCAKDHLGGLFLLPGVAIADGTDSTPVLVHCLYFREVLIRELSRGGRICISQEGRKETGEIQLSASTTPAEIRER